MLHKSTEFFPVSDVNEAPTKGCLNPFFASPEQSPGTILGYLNVTDPDNEIYKVTDQDTCQQKQQLKYAIVSEKEDIVPFEVTDGYLVKTGVRMDYCFIKSHDEASF